MKFLRRPTCWVAPSLLAMSLLNAVATADTSADVTELSGPSVRLTDVVTTSIEFHANGARLTIPVVAIRQIEAVDCHGRLKVTLVSGATRTGTSDSRISGKTSLGTYTLDLSKAGWISFTHLKRPRLKALVNGRTVYDLRCEFPFFGRGFDGGTSPHVAGQDSSSQLPVVIDDALYLIPFSKIEYVIPPTIKLYGRPAVDCIAFGRSRVIEGAPGNLLGRTKFATWQMSLDRVAKIQFIREQDAPAGASQQETSNESGEDNCCDGIQATITTQRGRVIPVADLAVLTTNSRGYRGAASPRVACRLGDGLHVVNLTELTGMHDVAALLEPINGFGQRLRITATLIAHDARRMPVELEDPYIYFAGESDLGYVVVRAQDVAKIDMDEQRRSENGRP